MSCVSCGEGTVPGASFCGSCGTAVSVGAAAESGVATPTADVDRAADSPMDPPAPAEAETAEAQASLMRSPIVPSARPPVDGARQGAVSDLTRYLCAAVYLDREYSRKLVRQVAAEPHLAVAPAPGCDVPLVLRHAYEANARRLGYDLLLTAMLILTFVFSFFVDNILLVLAALFLSWLIVFVFDIATRYGPSLQNLRPGRLDPAAMPAPPTKDIEERLRQIGGYATGNVTVYSGYSPFVGYGVQTNSWSFALDVTRPAEYGDAPPREIDVAELYAHVAQRLNSLSLPNLRVEERLFVDGAAIVGDERFVPRPLGRPGSEVSQEQLDELKRTPENRARPYLAVHSTGWDGQLVSSLFLRVTRSESNLFVEAVHTVLCPPLAKYKAVDTLLPHPTAGEVWKLLLMTPAGTIADLLASPVRLIMGLAPDFGVAGRVRRQRQIIEAQHGFDYGARLSVRQEASDTKYHRYFQKLDSDLALKVAEKRILDALAEFVEAHGVSIADLKGRQETIINNGIIATGDATITSSTVASGENARAWIKIPLPKLEWD